jgi:hypothetical protein
MGESRGDWRLTCVARTDGESRSGWRLTCVARTNSRSFDCASRDKAARDFAQDDPFLYQDDSFYQDGGFYQDDSFYTWLSANAFAHLAACTMPIDRYGLVGSGLAQGLEVVVEHSGEVRGEAGALGVGVGAEGALELDVLDLAGDGLDAGSAGEVGGGEADGALGGGLLLDDDVEGAVGLGGLVDEVDAAEGADGLLDLAGDGAGGVVARYGEEDVDAAGGKGAAGGAGEQMLVGVVADGGLEGLELGLGELVEADGDEVGCRYVEGLLDVGRPEGGCGLRCGFGLVRRGSCGWGGWWCRLGPGGLRYGKRPC